MSESQQVEATSTRLPLANDAGGTFEQREVNLPVIEDSSSLGAYRVGPREPLRDRGMPKEFKVALRVLIGMLLINACGAIGVSLIVWIILGTGHILLGAGFAFLFMTLVGIPTALAVMGDMMSNAHSTEVEPMAPVKRCSGGCANCRRTGEKSNCASQRQ